MPNITLDQITALAPDRASAQAGERLAQAQAWQHLGRNNQGAWGECQGSAAKPYRIQIEYAGAKPTTRCNCPSRKLPCKHAVGLLLLLASEPHLFPAQDPPEWAAEWLASRTPISEPTPNDAPPPAKANASNRRAAVRESRVEAGVQDARRWLHDLVRQGLAAAQQQPHSYWEHAAARLVDAQAPGLARQVRALPGIAASGRGWQERLLERIARLHLMIEGYSRIETLPEGVQADLRAAIGWTWNREELLQRPSVRYHWHVLGRRSWEEDGLRTQRTWLHGQQTDQFALLLDFAPAHQSINRTLVPGTMFEAELVFYPSAVPLRAVLQQQHETPRQITSIVGEPIEVALARYASASAHNPWIDQFPLLLGNVVPLLVGEHWRVRDAAGAVLSIEPRFEYGWQLLALSGGNPVGIFGEWDGAVLLPLGCWAEGVWVALGDER